MANTISVRLRRGRAIQPTTNFTLDLLIWLGSLSCLIWLAVQLAYTIVAYTQDSPYSQYYEEDVKMESGLVTLMSCLMCVFPSRSVNEPVLIRIL